MYCSNCGNNVDNNDSFCKNCGAKVPKNDEIFEGTVYEKKEAVSEQKSKVVAGILGILLGSFGVHNFYLGYVEKGIIQVVLTVFCLGWVSSVWGLVEGILILCGSTITTDAKGVPLKD